MLQPALSAFFTEWPVGPQISLGLMTAHSTLPLVFHGFTPTCDVILIMSCGEDRCLNNTVGSLWAQCLAPFSFLSRLDHLALSSHTILMTLNFTLLSYPSTQVELWLSLTSPVGCLPATSNSNSTSLSCSLWCCLWQFSISIVKTTVPRLSRLI